jgi:pilus assembly protein CpaB
MVYYLLRQVPTASTALVPTPTPIPSVSIPVAARVLEAGTTLTTTDIITRDYPETLLPVGVVTDADELAGQILVERLGEGEFFRPAQLANSAEGPLSSQIPPSRVVLAFPVTDLLNQSKVVNAGDNVDLLLTLDVTEGTDAEARTGRATSYTVQNIRVVKVVRPTPTEDQPSPEPTAILFELEPQDAVIVKFVKDSGGTLDFTLRSSTDTSIFETDAINQDYLFDNYGFRAPRTGARPQ